MIQITPMNDVEKKLQELRTLWKTNPEMRDEIRNQVNELRCCYYPGCEEYRASMDRVTCEIHGGKVIGEVHSKPLTIKQWQEKILNWRKS